MRRTVQPPEPGGVFDGICRQAERERDIGGRRKGDVGIAIVRVKEVDMRKAPAELVDVRQRYRPRRDAVMDGDEDVHFKLTSSTVSLFHFSTFPLPLRPPRFSMSRI